MKRLYTPFKVNKLELKNRVIMSPMSIQGSRQAQHQGKAGHHHCSRSTYPLAYSVHPQDRRRHGRNSRRRCIHRMWSDHSSRGRRKGHVDHHHLRRRRSLRCRPYGIPRREHLARRHSRTYPRTHHEQSLDIHPLPVHHHLSASFRYRLPVLLHGSHDSNLRLAA